MLVGYNYGSEDGEGAWLPVWVGLGSEAIYFHRHQVDLCCQKIFKGMCSRMSFCHVVCS